MYISVVSNLQNLCNACAADGTISKPPPEGANTEVQLHVQSLALILNKPEYELAKASVSHVNLHVAAR